MITPTYDQARSLLSRWGYRPIEGPDGEALGGRIWRCDDTSHDVLMLAPSKPSFTDNMGTLIGELAIRYNFSASEIRRIMAAELDPLRHLGDIELQPQTLDEFGEPEDHAPAKIIMDKRGRDRLIAALIEGRGAIDVYGPSGGGYELQIEVK